MPNYFGEVDGEREAEGRLGVGDAPSRGEGDWDLRRFRVSVSPLLPR